MSKISGSTFIKLLLGVVVASTMNVSQASSGDAVAGKKVFNKCKACHTFGKSKIGPDLAGIIDRPAASIEGYKYSKAMKASGVTWTEENLAQFLKKPKAFIPKTRMGFGGLKKEKQIQDILAYLKEASAQ